LKGKSAIWIAQTIGNQKRNLTGHKFWARRYFASIVGVNEKVIRKYIQNQEREENRLEEFNLFNR
jgi:putative transposase